MDAYAGTCPEPLVSAPTSCEAEFEQRLADSSSLAFRVALGVLRNREDAEEIAQEAFLRAYRNFSQLREREKFRGWLARISFRLALDRLRSTGRRQRRESAVLHQAVPARTVEDLAAAGEFQARLECAVDELPEKLRVVVILAAVQGYDTRETAALLDLPEGTVKSRLHAARKALAEKLR
jgi:RNA polymerase sigma-70 factor (ECF subfamily)